MRSEFRAFNILDKKMHEVSTIDFDNETVMLKLKTGGRFTLSMKHVVLFRNNPNKIANCNLIFEEDIEDEKLEKMLIDFYKKEDKLEKKEE